MNCKSPFTTVALGLALSGALVACADDTPVPIADSATVYRSAEKRQCEEGGLTSAQSIAALTGAGVHVMRSGCGMLAGVMYPAVCGGATGDIVLHEIAGADLPSATGAGYADAQGLARAGGGAGYDWIDCDTRLPLR